MKISSFPSEEEQELVRRYVMERPLYRPNITYLKATIILIFLIIGIIFVSIVSFHILSLIGFFIKKTLFYSVFVIVSVIIFARWIAILAVNLYQHYAPEDVRRRCLLKPTCSEYAKIVLRRYGFIIGIVKIWIRLNYKCRGDVYYMDEP